MTDAEYVAPDISVMLRCSPKASLEARGVSVQRGPGGGSRPRHQRLVLRAHDRGSGRGVQPHHDVLVVIAKALAEDVEAAWVLGVALDADAHADRVMDVEVEVGERHVGD